MSFLSNEPAMASLIPVMAGLRAFGITTGTTTTHLVARGT